ncbi:MAG: hypothetical protein K0R65_903 [Crocinitomicaceae bacterium]|jgi:hypothetical protein|nr:hypothetical protein [Crocinitomicaceae bacterium]
MKKILGFLLFAFCLATNALADSPLTSTEFFRAYLEVKEVKYASENSLDKKLLDFLGSAKADPVHKLAVINALSWGKTEYATTFEEYLLKKRKGLKKEVFDYLRMTENSETPQETEQTRLLTADDLMCWSYLQTMGDYFQPAMGMRGAYFGYARNPQSMAHITSFSLIAAQQAFDTDWCQVYMIPKTMLEDTAYTQNLLKPEAVTIIMEYIGLYAAECE